MLEPVGIPASEEALFRQLIDHPSSTAAELALLVGYPPTDAQALLGALEHRGLIVREAEAPDRFTPTLPDLALERLILRRQEELEQVREVAHALTEQFRQKVRVRPTRLAELVSGVATVKGVARAVLQSATRSVLVTERPPYAEAGRPEPEHPDADLARRGVVLRRIHHRPMLDTPEAVVHLQERLGAGEDVRVLNDVPLKLLVVDGRRAVVPLDPDASVFEAAVVVHARPLVNALVLCFEAMWSRAVPIRARHHDVAQDGQQQPDKQDRQLLTLLAAGLKDEAVARQLGLSSRTVVRRVDRLMKALGADTRFQAGLQAVRRGWL